MSDTSSGGRQTSTKKRPKAAAKGGDARASSEGVLANLPRTRPQRSSARRDAARQATPATPETKTKPAPKAKPPRKQTTAKKQPSTVKKQPSRAKLTAQPIQDPAPRQGFEAESDQLSGPVQPPGGVDLFASAAELAGELTRSGLSAGGRLLKDALARLPLN
jgi:hypothetical protein